MLPSWKDWKKGNVPVKNEPKKERLPERIEIGRTAYEAEETFGLEATDLSGGIPIAEFELPKLEDLVAADPLAKLNEATEEELANIKGVGPKRLKQILSQRPFEDENELRKALPTISGRLIDWASA
jgi:DNA uptake protein ComE-like DNA-binding protein